MRTRRIGWIDVAKGIGIAFVVLGHTHIAGRQYLYTFHLPLFFFISGFLLQSGPSFRVSIVKRARMLLVPYVFFSFVSLIMTSLVVGKDWDLGPALLQLAVSTRGRIDVNPTLWFFTCMFLVQVMYLVLIRLVKNPYARLGLVLPLSLWGFPTAANPTLPFSLDAACYFLVFLAIGDLTSAIGDLRSSRLFVAVAGACVIITAYLMVSPGRVSAVAGLLAERSALEQFLAAIALALVGIFAVILVAFALEGSPLLTALGRSSLSIFVLHVIVLDWLYYLLTALGLTVTQTAGAYAVLAAGVAIAVSLPLARVFERHFGWWLGNRLTTGAQSVSA